MVPYPPFFVLREIKKGRGPALLWDPTRSGIDDSPVKGSFFFYVWIDRDGMHKMIKIFPFSSRSFAGGVFRIQPVEPLFGSLSSSEEDTAHLLWIFLTRHRGARARSTVLPSFFLCEFGGSVDKVLNIFLFLSPFFWDPTSYKCNSLPPPPQASLRNPSST